MWELRFGWTELGIKKKAVVAAREKLGISYIFAEPRRFRQERKRRKDAAGRRTSYESSHDRVSDSHSILGLCPHVGFIFTKPLSDIREHELQRWWCSMSMEQGDKLHLAWSVDVQCDTCHVNNVSGVPKVAMSKVASTHTVALTEFASRSFLVKVHLKKKSGGRKTRR